jgi:hypothetical protein
MKILDIQQRHASVFNIRFGEKVRTRNGKLAPAKLTDKLRVTSPNQSVVQAFVDVYGGEVRRWEEGGWESYLPRTDLPIMVLPGQSVDQAWEMYKGSVRVRACEGAGGIETKTGKPCMCDPDIEKRMADSAQCSLMTRLNFICPEVAVVGAGTLITHGRIAAETLPQAVQVAEAALRAGNMVPAVLRAVLKVGQGREYVVPQIEILGLSVNQLMSGELPAPGRAQIAAPQAGQLVEQERAIGRQTLSLPSTDKGGDGLSPGQGEARSSSASDSPVASPEMRRRVEAEASKRGMSNEELEELVLEVTEHYLDEADLTVNHVNDVLDAIRQKGQQ